MRFVWLAFVLALSMPSGSYGIPAIDKVVAFQEASVSYLPIILKDSVDPEVFYLPFNRMKISPVEDGSGPDLSVAYDTQGLSVQMTVQPAVDQEGLAPAIAEIKKDHPQARFRTLPITRGRFVSTLRNFDQLESIAAGKGDFGVPHLNATAPRPLQFQFLQPVANLIVLSIAAAGGFSFNYEYAFQAAVTASTAKVTIDWTQVSSIVKTLPKAPYTGAALERFLARLQADQLVEIETTGNGFDVGTILPQISANISGRCFHTKSFGTGANETKGYEPKADGCVAADSVVFYKSEPQMEVQAAAGFQLTSLCFSHPSHFAFKGANGQVVQGCPAGVYGTDGGAPKKLDVAPDMSSSKVPGPIIGS